MISVSFQNPIRILHQKDTIKQCDYEKNWMLFLFFAASAALTFSGCSDDDNSDVPENTHLVSKEVQAAFNAKYPQAKDVEWELKGDYAVVDFNWDGGEHSAWFNPLSAAWYMTETDVRYENLPEPILTAHKASKYADWRVDDVDKLTREGMETLYVIEVEKESLSWICFIRLQAYW